MCFPFVLSVCQINRSNSVQITSTKLVIDRRGCPVRQYIFGLVLRVTQALLYFHNVVATIREVLGPFKKSKLCINPCRVHCFPRDLRNN